MLKIHCPFDEMRDVDLLVEHPKNANRHSEKQIAMLAKILEYQGWRAPILVSKRTGLIVAGHGRLQAAKRLGEEKVPVSVQAFENEAQELAHLTADNKVAALAEHDDSMFLEYLKEADLGDLDLEDLNFELFGFDDLSFLNDGEKEKEKAPDTSEKKFIIEVSFPNDMEMMDIHDDLVSRGYIVKIK